jgi:uncharacterized protein YhbP (UPF0306 family)
VPTTAGSADDRRTALAYLRDHHVLSLSVTDADGPWAAAVFYATDEFRCLFVSSPDARHARAIEADGRAAATVNEQPEDWTQIRGLQLEGHVRRLSGLAHAAALARYFARFASVSADPRLAGALRKAAMYEFVPDRVYLIDNRRFGQRLEIDLGAVPAAGAS